MGAREPDTRSGSDEAIAMKADDRYATIVRSLRGKPGVEVGFGKKGFGSSALRVGGKIFAMLSSQGEFVVKLPRERVDELVASKKGKRFDPGGGRVMKEWFAAAPGTEDSWLPLAREAMRFVGSKA